VIVKTLPVGITYAIWAGMGIVLVAIVSAVMYKQMPDLPAVIGMSLIIIGVIMMPDLPAVIGMSLIIIGVIIINVFSKTVAH
jgi:small multidrug resistance pump